MCLLFLSFVFSLCISFVPLGLGLPQRNSHSFCPYVFSYETITYDGDGDWVFPSENHRWRGVISVTPALPIVLKVKLLIPALLPSKFSGRLVLAKDKNEVVSQIQSGNLDKIVYYIYFPSRVPIPELVLIQVNSKTICSRTPLPHRVRTILTLEHSLIPISNNVTLRDGVGGGPNLWTHQIFDSAKTLSEVNVCGKGIFKKSFNSKKPSISIGDWPWMVPLFKKTELGLQFFCSSTLVSYVLVITAAHCLHLKNTKAVDQKEVVAYVGRFDITNWTEENVQPRELSDVFIHPDYDPENLRSDLAVLKFSKPVQPSPNVAPACLWQGDDNLAAIVGLNGVVFGWGTDGSGKKITPTPKLAVMPIVSQEICLRSKMEFLYLTTNRTLCAGFRNGTGPCSGDSGGGLLVAQKGSDGQFRWFLRGVVSISLVQHGQIMCDVHEYTVFTDVAKYQKWIAEFLS